MDKSLPFEILGDLVNNPSAVSWIKNSLDNKAKMIRTHADAARVKHQDRGWRAAGDFLGILYDRIADDLDSMKAEFMQEIEARKTPTQGGE